MIEAGFNVTEHDTLAPDVAVAGRMRLAEEGRLVNGAPEIGIEVVSPTDTFRGITRKIRAYLEKGAFFVWIFNDDGSIAVHTSSPDSRAERRTKLEDPWLPGFSVSASAFFTPSRVLV